MKGEKHIIIPIRFGNELYEDKRKPIQWTSYTAGDELLVEEDNSAT